ncbi:MAG: hypothetical protein ACXVDJ_00840 [Tumebacillaceae bacterium]
MGFVIFTSMAFLLLLTFVCLPKKLHPAEYAFVWLAFVPVFITAFDIATPLNSYHIKPTKSPMLFAAHRLSELIVIPLLLLIYLDVAHRMRTWTRRIGAFVVCFLLLNVVEFMSVHLHLFTYLDWSAWRSSVFWLVFLLYAILLQIGMRQLLKKEGIVA